MSDSEKPKMGRPPKGETERRRNLQSFRITDADKAQLDRAAYENQRSISEEVEFRLKRYEDLKRLFADLYVKEPGDDPIIELLHVVAKVIRAGRNYAKKRELSELETRSLLSAILGHVSDFFFWDGHKLRGPEPFTHTDDPTVQRVITPDRFAYEVVENALAWDSVMNKCDIYDDYADGIIRNIWSGAESPDLQVGEGIQTPPPTRPLSEIMPREQGAPISPLFDKKTRKTKKKGADDV